MFRLVEESRSGYYRHLKTVDNQQHTVNMVIGEVRKIRMQQPRMGTRKLYYVLQSKFKQIGLKVGRDRLFKILGANNLLVKKRKKYTQTTNSNHWLKKHKNRILEQKITRPEEVFVSDITYLQTAQGYTYLSLVTDAYSKKIMGFHLADNLKTEGCIEALKMAIRQRIYQTPLIHHSDRGVQYCSDSYQKLLKKNNITCSMTESYDPYQNAVAERVNGILKDEFFGDIYFPSFSVAQKVIQESIDIYNYQRPHWSNQLLTPQQMHIQSQLIPKSWKKKPPKNKSLEIL